MTAPRARGRGRRRRPGWRCAPGSPWARPGRDARARVLLEDRPLEVTADPAGLDPELLDERAAGVPVGLQRVGLPAGAVERQHQLPARPLAQRVLGDERLELRDQLGVAAEREIGLDPVLEAARRSSSSRAISDLGERLEGEVRERRPAPERERLRKPRRRARGSPCAAGSAAFLGAALEARRSSCPGRRAARSRAGAWRSRRRRPSAKDVRSRET